MSDTKNACACALYRCTPKVSTKDFKVIAEVAGVDTKSSESWEVTIPATGQRVGFLADSDAPPKPKKAAAKKVGHGRSGQAIVPAPAKATAKKAAAPSVELPPE
jgi:hypothetical protein